MEGHGHEIRTKGAAHLRVTFVTDIKGPVETLLSPWKLQPQKPGTGLFKTTSGWGREDKYIDWFPSPLGSASQILALLCFQIMHMQALALSRVSRRPQQGSSKTRGNRWGPPVRGVACQM